MTVPGRARFRRITRLFEAACDLPAGEQRPFLLRECGDDTGLLREVELLLSRDGRSADPGIFGRLGDVLAAPSDQHPELPRPEWIGAYEIIDVVGTGGMGVVYRAREHHPRREVALKILRSDMTDPRALQRFERETAALARLGHRGIAQIFAAGTAVTGAGPQPFFAMELVDGLPLTQYAEAHELSVRARLRILIEVCAAVEHAHRRGIVHRDLKPANILVTADGSPKVLDFGVARVTDEERMTTMRTSVQSLVGTLPYMSPEQAQGDLDHVDARSDVYSLGVVAYQMLVGALPYDLHGKPLAHAARLIIEDDPRPLSSCDARLRGDLETILGKALEKEPGRRYASADELSSDFQRYLRDEPVQARPPTAWYQLTKLAKRNRKLFVAIAVAFTALMVGTATSVILAAREARARSAAEEEATRAQQVASLALGIFSPDEFAKPNPSPLAMLDYAAERANEQLADQPDLLGDFYAMIGRFHLALGHPEPARSVVERAVIEHRKVQGEFPEKLEQSLDLLQGILETVRDARATAPIWAEIADLRARMFGAGAESTIEARVQQASYLGRAGDFRASSSVLRRLTSEIADAMTPRRRMNLGSILYRSGDFREAEALLRPVLDAPLDSPDSPEEDVLFWAAFQLAALYADVGDLEQADRASNELLEARGATSGNPGVMAYGAYMRAHVLHCLGRHREAEQLAREAVSVVEGNSVLRVAFPWRVLGASLLGQGRLDEAEQALREYFRRQSALTGDGAWYVGQAQALLGNVLRERGQLDEALALGRAGLERTRRSLQPFHPRVADALEPLARTLVELERFDEAERLCHEAIDIRERVMDREAIPIASVQLILAEVHAGRGAGPEAMALATAARARLVDALPADHPELGGALHVVAKCAAAASSLDARESWQAAVDLCERILPRGHPDTDRSCVEFGLFLWQSGEHDKAVRLLRPSIERLEASLDPQYAILQHARSVLAAYDVQQSGR